MGARVARVLIAPLSLLIVPLTIYICMRARPARTPSPPRQVASADQPPHLHPTMAGGRRQTLRTETPEMPADNWGRARSRALDMHNAADDAPTNERTDDSERWRQKRHAQRHDHATSTTTASTVATSPGDCGRYCPQAGPGSCNTPTSSTDGTADSRPGSCFRAMTTTSTSRPDATSKTRNGGSHTTRLDQRTRGARPARMLLLLLYSTGN